MAKEVNRDCLCARRLALTALFLERSKITITSFTWVPFRHTRLELKPITLQNDTTLNSFDAVCSNIYTNFAVTARKACAYIRALSPRTCQHAHLIGEHLPFRQIHLPTSLT